MQRVCRQAIQAIHSQILAVNVQYHKALAHYKKTQMDGAHTHVETSPKAKDRDNKQDKKKKGDDKKKQEELMRKKQEEEEDRKRQEAEAARQRQAEEQKARAK